MVVKLEGKVDGQVIIFERESGDLWQATIPPQSNGVYIVELTATDDAGNVAYCAKYIITIDVSALTVRIEPFDKYAIPEEDDINAKELLPKFKTIIKVQP